MIRINFQTTDGRTPVALEPEPARQLWLGLGQALAGEGFAAGGVSAVPMGRQLLVRLDPATGRDPEAAVMWLDQPEATLTRAELGDLLCDAAPVGPCPPWCAEQPGHAWEGVDRSGRPDRVHQPAAAEADPAGPSVHAVQHETPDGLSGWAVLLLDVPDDGLTPAAALELAAQLQQVAGLAE